MSWKYFSVAGRMQRANRTLDYPMLEASACGSPGSSGAPMATLKPSRHTVILHRWTRSSRVTDPCLGVRGMVDWRLGACSSPQGKLQTPGRGNFESHWQLKGWHKTSVFYCFSLRVFRQRRRDAVYIERWKMKTFSKKMFCFFLCFLPCIFIVFMLLVLPLFCFFALFFSLT
jgi:hypothetical protein